MAKGKIELRQNPKTGIVESWQDGKKIGEVITMGDLIGPAGEKAERENGNSGKHNDIGRKDHDHR